MRGLVITTDRGATTIPIAVRASIITAHGRWSRTPTGRIGTVIRDITAVPAVGTIAAATVAMIVIVTTTGTTGTTETIATATAAGGAIK